MRWEARTNYREIDIDTILCIYQTPQMAYQRPPSLVGDHQLMIELSQGGWINARIENAGLASAILVMPDGVRYQITPRREDELDSRIVLPGMYSQDWIVRSQIVQP